MSTFTLKSIAQRGSLLVAAVGLVAASVAPAVFADALNPLTERSLLLSSSAPGWQDTDGSGYSTASPNPGAIGSPTLPEEGVSGEEGYLPERPNPNYIPGSYAPAGSGANGRKTGETFSFRLSTAATPAAPIHAFTLQYCTEAAGNCQAPGDNEGDARSGASTPRDTNAQGLAKEKSDLDVNYTGAVAGTDFKILVNGTEISNYTDWTMDAVNLEDTGHSKALTGKRNYVTLKSPTGITAAAANEKIQIIFVASESKHITNPGSGSFFVKMNTYSSATSQIGSHNDPTPDVTTDHTVIDGGVTVANVMADSIHITTKVLETMQFSVGTHNPDTDVKTQPADHGTCQNIETPNGNRLELGNQDAEFSLQTDRGFSVSSYWRLSSNSSGGATVYYSGETLTNTVGDIITPAGGNTPNTEVTTLPGTEQFGLGFETHEGVSSSFTSAISGGGGAYRLPSLYVLQKNSAYDEADGTLGQTGTGGGAHTGDAKFAFDRRSLTNPVAIADNLANGAVLTCETAKMRYIANIAADTPAGVYTTKINYLAAPQY